MHTVGVTYSPKNLAAIAVTLLFEMVVLFAAASCCCCPSSVAAATKYVTNASHIAAVRNIIIVVNRRYTVAYLINIDFCPSHVLSSISNRVVCLYSNGMRDDRVGWMTTTTTMTDVHYRWMRQPYTVAIPRGLFVVSLRHADVWVLLTILIFENTPNWFTVSPPPPPTVCKYAWIVKFFWVI